MIPSGCTSSLLVDVQALTTRDGGNADIAGANICHLVLPITAGVWLLGFGFLRRPTSYIPVVVCRLLTTA